MNKYIDNAAMWDLRVAVMIIYDGVSLAPSPRNAV